MEDYYCCLQPDNLSLLLIAMIKKLLFDHAAKLGYLNSSAWESAIYLNDIISFLVLSFPKGTFWMSLYYPPFISNMHSASEIGKTN